jgi:PEP-CTERM motif-containing protein
MRPVLGIWLRSLCALAVIALLADPAGATGFWLQVHADGLPVGSYYEQDLGCVEAGTGRLQCSGGNPGDVVGSLPIDTIAGGLRLDSWNILVVGDPVVTGPVVVTNLAGVTQQFTFTFTLPVAPIGPSSVTGGSVQGGMTDSNGDGVTLSTAVGSAFYTALIDGGNYQALYADPQSFSAAAFQSGNVPNLAFGVPIPSQAGPPVASSIGVRIDFLLTGNDQASFTSNFVVQVPEPGTAELLGVGLLLLGLRFRRR